MQPRIREARKDTRVLSEAVRKAVEARSATTPLVVTGISEGKLVTIEPSRFERLDVDPSYQRGETNMVNEIIRAVQAGGMVLDPVTLCRRPWENGDGSKLWIVDGHQRVCAFQQLQKPIRAMIHDSASLDAEKVFFQALNSRKHLSADLVVKSWIGPSGHLVARVNVDEHHPLFGRVHFQQGSNPHRIGATVLIRGMLHAAAGVKGSGTAIHVLSRLDTALAKSKENKARAEHYLRLIGYIFPKGSVSPTVATTLGIVAYERWSRNIALPPMPIIEKFKEVKWAEQVPVLSKKFQPVLVEIARKVWR